jgi:hypothetical protein
MTTKIVLNKKIANNEFGILKIQSFYGYIKKKKIVGIRISVYNF